MGNDLKGLLSSLNVAALKELLAHIPGAGEETRKDDIINRIARGMEQPTLTTIWNGLDETQQLAVAESLYDAGGEYSAKQFEAKYRRLPAFRQPGPEGHRGSIEVRSALTLFIHYVYLGRGVALDVVPGDLRARLTTFVPCPAKMELKCSQTLPDTEELTVRLTEREATQELAVMLRTIAETRLPVGDKTAVPGAAAVKALSEKLVGGDFYAGVVKKNVRDREIGAIKAFAWPLLLQAGGLVSRAGGRMGLRPAGQKALVARPEPVIKGLWEKWVQTAIFDEFSRIDEIKGQNSKGPVMTDVGSRRETIDDALRACPPGQWVMIDDFSRFIRATDDTFSVSTDPWKLYIAEREYGSLGDNGSDGWNILEERYLLVLLFEYAATLGMVDVAFVNPAGARNDFGDLWGTDDLDYLSRYDGLRAFRLTPLGAYVFGDDVAYEAESVQGNATLTVLPELNILVQGELNEEECFVLRVWTAQRPDGGWHLDTAKTIETLENGQNISVLRGFLESRSTEPLHERAVAFLERCAKNSRALKITGQANIVECNNSESADLISRHKDTKTLCVRIGPKMLMVRTQHQQKFHVRVRALGIGMVD